MSIFEPAPIELPADSPVWETKLSVLKTFMTKCRPDSEINKHYKRFYHGINSEQNFVSQLVSVVYRVT